MDKTLKYQVGTMTALLAAATFFTASAVPTQEEVDQARTECREHRERVKKRNGFARDEEKRAWEAACGRASVLMDELAGMPPEAAGAAMPEAQPAPQADQTPQAAQAEMDSAPASATPSTPSTP